MGLSPKQIAKALQVRASILEAAARIITTSGVDDLTLDLVAKEAGVSKGGLLHHYKSKTALLTALLESLMLGLEDSIKNFENADQNPHGRKIRAYIKAMMMRDTEQKKIGVSILTAFLFSAELMDEWKSMTKRWIDEDFMNSNPLRESLIRSSINGLVLSQAFGLQELDVSSQDKLVSHLIRLTE